MTPEIVVLLQEPDPEVSHSLAAMLQVQGHQVRTTAGEVPELAKIHSDPPALIVLPVHMKDINAFELCKSLRRHERTRHTPLLLITDVRSQEVEAFRSGASDVIPAPFEQAEVLARIQTQLDLASLRSSRQARSSVSPEAGNDDGWIQLAMQAGRMHAFEWDILTDAVRCSGDCAWILGESDPNRATPGSAFQHIDPDDKERLQQIFAILSPVYDMYDTQIRARRADGKWTHLRVSGRGLFDSSGRLARVIGMAADISEQVAAQNELQQNQRDLYQLIQKLPLAVALAADQGRIDYINDRFTKTFGYGLQDMTDSDAWLKRAYPDAGYRKAFMDNWLTSADAAASQGDDIPAREYQITGKDGAMHSVEVLGAVVGKRRLMLLNDVTERRRANASLRESEERFRVMANTAPVMLWVAGTDKLCNFFNKGWLAFTGRTMEQEIGNGWAEGIHADDLDRCLATYFAAFDKREAFQMEYRLRRADGEYRWVLDTGTPRFAADGAFGGFIGSALDITDLRRRQEQMLVAQRLESLGVLAGGVAHDFNNLLGCILANADVTMSELDINSAARDGLERIEAVAVRAAQIVRQIMTYIGEEQEDLQPVDLSHLVREMLQLLRVCIPKRARLNIELPPSMLVPRANAAQLRQVVMNLIINAGEALGDAAGVISVSGKRGCWYYDRRTVVEAGSAGSDGGFVCLEVSDTGVGMSPEVLQRIFDPFFSTKLAGRGFGLAAVQTIIRSHGGIIEVTSTPGKGSTFQVLLPADIKAPMRIPAEPPPQGKFSRQGSVLVVEDEETLRVSVAKMLSKKGFYVLEAADGDRAINLIHDLNQDIALVLLDLTLPGKSSQGVFDELQRVRPGVKVILTSPYGRENADPLPEIDPPAFIRKPYHLSELVTVVRQALPGPHEGAKRGAKTH